MKEPWQMTLKEFGQYRSDLFKKGQNPWGGLSNKAALEQEINKALPQPYPDLKAGRAELKPERKGERR